MTLNERWIWNEVERDARHRSTRSIKRIQFKIAKKLSTPFPPSSHDEEKLYARIEFPLEIKF
jgi:hypothetical protein